MSLQRLRFAAFFPVLAAVTAGAFAGCASSTVIQSQPPGARVFMNAHPELVTEVACDGVGSDDDIDTPEDLARLRGDLEDRSSCT